MYASLWYLIYYVLEVAVNTLLFSVACEEPTAFVFVVGPKVHLQSVQTCIICLLDCTRFIFDVVGAVVDNIETNL